METEIKREEPPEWPASAVVNSDYLGMASHLVPTWLLDDLCDKNIVVLFSNLKLATGFTPLCVRTAQAVVFLASTCKRFRTVYTTLGLDFESRHEMVKALCENELRSTHWSEMHNADKLHWSPCSGRLTFADIGALVDIMKTNGLPKLRELDLNEHRFDADSVQALAGSIGHATLPSLTSLGLGGNNIDKRGALALCAALHKDALPLLQVLKLARNRLGSAGLIAMTPILRALPNLKKLYLMHNEIGDAGVVAFVGERVPMSLEVLDLDANNVGDEGCAALTDFIERGFMPSLTLLFFDNNPASKEAKMNTRVAVHWRRDCV